MPAQDNTSFTPINVLFVCTGNICRSPTADGLFRHLVEREGLDDLIHTDSCGTIAYHEGDTPDPRAQAEARRRGMDISTLRARALRTSDFQRFDYIMAMDEGHLLDIESQMPDTFTGTVCLLMDFADGDHHGVSVPDPYYGGAQGFRDVFDLVEEGCEGLLRHIREAEGWIAE